MLSTSIFCTWHTHFALWSITLSIPLAIQHHRECDRRGEHSISLLHAQSLLHILGQWSPERLQLKQLQAAPLLLHHPRRTAVPFAPGVSCISRARSYQRWVSGFSLFLQNVFTKMRRDNYRFTLGTCFRNHRCFASVVNGELLLKPVKQ